MFYFLVVLISCLTGAVAGIGGAVIIKPVMDAVSPYDAETVGILASFCVLLMAVVSVTRHAIQKTPFEKKTVIFISAGAVAGGILGKLILSVAAGEAADSKVKTVQAVISVFLLAFVYVYMNVIKDRLHFNLKNPLAVAAVGLALGMLSAFLGVGGGPFNVAFLCLFFSMDMKNASIHSLAIIIFSQSSKLISAQMGEGLLSYDLSPLVFMLPAAVIGALAGSAINRKISSEKIKTVYNVAVLVIIAINLTNIIRLR